MKSRLPLLLTLATTLILATGCSRSDPTQGSGLVAPHGGTLVALGDQQYHLEVVLDRRTGMLRVHVLDAQAKDFVRVDWRTLELTFRLEAGLEAIVLNAMATDGTGDGVGNTATFAGVAPWLQRGAALDGVVPALTIQGQSLPSTTFVILATSGLRN
jgi:hypothetical protein